MENVYFLEHAVLCSTCHCKAGADAAQLHKCMRREVEYVGCSRTPVDSDGVPNFGTLH